MNTHINKINPIVIFLMGTTASHKTEIAMKLAHTLPIELISVDASLIYKEMNIGTAKPNKNNKFYCQHWLIDIREPCQQYSVYEFYQDAIQLIHNIIKKGKIPLLVGGTMYYFYRLMYSISPMIPKSSIHIQNLITKQIINNKFYTHYDMLNIIDPISAKKIHYNDIRRIMRALEIFFITGKTLSTLIKIPNLNIPYPIHQFAITYYDQTQLFKAIHNRIINMIELGFEQEVRSLINNNVLQYDYPAMRCIGYKQMFHFIKNKINFQTMLNETILMTKYLSKKQMTWLKKWDNVTWLNSSNKHMIYNTIAKLVDKQLI
ncbi:tRNA (adenosine(37)-N6)-dimethylallyltransferase MiaA [Enterobacteriaceae endosymbiont of Macroplea mutica]|uniref:tRNA (adenosine(37)-N6)-dimethylallyltransferase MiaA n=1 Tax=Enterobacteriaceae endosymbiont of Macroplea mutica TaxID=2675791 RepID=UPI001449B647|nr:tRNA (adenosine(37)-N6)-dimethylallyltransferase MiaA [Enterobacteriaceae endosymbiont of Macroplea mutica]QJC31208.1 tRNA (adenosine(37)-N6)-dimethylallyltransferase MiaA [Enterobacteriaceae endosymbiont of Macroplea mutica]